MDIVYQIFSYIGLVIILVTAIVAFTWQARKGKSLLCIALLLSFLAAIVFRVWNTLIQLEVLEWSVGPSTVVNAIGMLLYHASAILLLLYVIVARKSPSESSVYPPPVPEYSPMQSVAGVDNENPYGAIGAQGDISTEAVDTTLVGIGGWLMFPAIGLVLSCILSIIGFITCIAMFQGVADAGFGGYFALNVFLVQPGLIIFLFVAAFMFFGKKKSTPAVMIALMATGIVVSLVLMIIAIGMEAEVFAIGEGKDLVRGIIGAAIWIPYFTVSKRVKATFVN
jgi:Protein of unknown function (DUF2569)